MSPPRRSRSASSASPRSSTRRSHSAPPRVRGSPSPRRPTPRRSPRRSPRRAAPGRFKRALGALTWLLALSRGAGGPRNQPRMGGPGGPFETRLRVRPGNALPPSIPVWSTTYNYGLLPRAPVREINRRAPAMFKSKPFRMMFPGGHAPAGMYMPQAPAIFTGRHRPTIPGPILPVITASQVRAAENHGLVFPASVHRQARHNATIMGNMKVPSWMASKTPANILKMGNKKASAAILTALANAHGHKKRLGA